MQNLKLKETLTQDDIKRATPTEEDFVLMSEAYLDQKINGVDAAPSHKLDMLDTMGDVDAPARLVVVAALLDWKEAIKFFKEKHLDYNLTLAQLKELVQAVRTQKQAYLEDMYEKYCTPAFEAIQDYRSGKQPKAKDISDKFRLLVRYMLKNRDHDVLDTHIAKLDDTGFIYYEGRDGTAQTKGYYFVAECRYDSAQVKWKLVISKAEYFSPTKEVVLMDVGQSWETLLEKLGVYFNVPDIKSAEYDSLINESLQAETELTETVEKHEELNPALFDENENLKPKVKDKINEIVNEFLKDFVEVEVELDVQDIILTGSNASYNYTKDSDLDIHIIADTSKIEDTLNLHKVIYNAYKSAFNRKFEIELNSVPIEVYVETQDTPLVSNGIYSVMKDDWVKKPTKEDIPEVDQEAIDKAFKPWEEKYRSLVNKIDGSTTDETEIDTFINDLYDLRKKGLSADGEYSIENLIFKEMRNNGYLDNLKDLRHKVIARRLSLHESLDSLTSCLQLLYKLN
jgi:predicted nucleotidyltransferase